MDPNDGDNAVATASQAKLQFDLVWLASNPLTYVERKGQNSYVHSVHPLDLITEQRALAKTLTESGMKLRFKRDYATIERLSTNVILGCRVLHYTGHGIPSGLGFETDSGHMHLVRTETLRALIETGVKNGGVELVFVAACHSEPAGMAFVKAKVKHVIAVRVRERVQDEGARHFQNQFYLGLVRGRTVKDAFDFAQKSLQSIPGLLHAKDEAKKYLLLPETADHNVRIFPDLSRGEVEDHTKALSRTNLPTSVPQFMGRNPQVQNIVQKFLSKKSRLVTLVGERNVGKTAISIDAARYMHDRGHFKNGVFWMRFEEFKAYSSEQTIVEHIAVTMDLIEDTSSSQKPISKQELLHLLRSRDVLMVLDGLDPLLSPATTTTIHGSSIGGDAPPSIMPSYSTPQTTAKKTMMMTSTAGGGGGTFTDDIPPDFFKSKSVASSTTTTSHHNHHQRHDGKGGRGGGLRRRNTISSPSAYSIRSAAVSSISAAATTATSKRNIAIVITDILRHCPNVSILCTCCNGVGVTREVVEEEVLVLPFKSNRIVASLFLNLLGSAIKPKQVGLDPRRTHSAEHMHAALSNHFLITKIIRGSPGRCWDAHVLFKKTKGDLIKVIELMRHHLPPTEQPKPLISLTSSSSSSPPPGGDGGVNSGVVLLSPTPPPPPPLHSSPSSSSNLTDTSYLPVNSKDLRSRQYEKSSKLQDKKTETFWKVFGPGRVEISLQQFKDRLHKWFCIDTRTRRSLSKDDVDKICLTCPQLIKCTRSGRVSKDDFHKWYFGWYKRFRAPFHQIRHYWNSWLILGVSTTRDKVSSVLSGSREGSFVIRTSINHPGCLALGYVDSDRSIVHVKIDYCNAAPGDDVEEEDFEEEEEGGRGTFRTFVGHRGGHEAFNSLSQLVLDFRKATSLHMGSKEEMLLRLSQVAAAAAECDGLNNDSKKNKDDVEQRESEINGYISMAKDDFKHEHHHHHHQQQQQQQAEDSSNRGNRKEEENNAVARAGGGHDGSSLLPLRKHHHPHTAGESSAIDSAVAVDNDRHQHHHHQQHQYKPTTTTTTKRRLAPSSSSSSFSVETAPKFWQWPGQSSVRGTEWKVALKKAFLRHTRAKRPLSEQALNLMFGMISATSSGLVFRNHFEKWYKCWYEPFCSTVCRIRHLWDSFVILGVTHSRESVRNILQNDQCGSFVLRLSGNAPGSLALGYVNENRNVVHMQIITGRRMMGETNAFMVQLENRKYLKFDTLEELVIALTPAKMLHPIPKEWLFHS